MDWKGASPKTGRRPWSRKHSNEQHAYASFTTHSTAAALPKQYAFIDFSIRQTCMRDAHHERLSYQRMARGSSLQFAGPTICADST
eukprot:874814-Pleurochrysis_carterae.AAC.2